MRLCNIIYISKQCHNLCNILLGMTLLWSKYTEPHTNLLGEISKLQIALKLLSCEEKFKCQVYSLLGFCDHQQGVEPRRQGTGASRKKICVHCSLTHRLNSLCKKINFNTLKSRWNNLLTFRTPILRRRKLLHRSLVDEALSSETSVSFFTFFVFTVLKCIFFNCLSLSIVSLETPTQLILVNRLFPPPRRSMLLCKK